ncbi:MAG TPA: hypothetical protein DCZ94_18125 [Lentisphaeria bacterium]|nr:MAG: hypothetical protein A2X48_23065 [Lentisphaerae bacterium GWF2_49_21]HBC88864.1 hypothetical protein [Lentisphaeria bacterium]
MKYEKYILKNRGGHRLEGQPCRKYKNAVVIPAYAEMEFLPHALKALSENNPAELEETMIVVVVNNPPPGAADPAKVRENTEKLEAMRNSQFPYQYRLQFFWIDASSHGLEINPKEGVGAARKIGMDAALEFLDLDRGAPLIISLDADTMVEKNYLETIHGYFISNPGMAGATVNFRHQPGRTPEEDAAITQYELFMRYYVEGLRISQSPYAYNVLGSAMVCKAEDYVRSGGMRRRNGGEDFYFMQALRKLGGIGQITGTTVHPSPRPSDRVPFGTGPRISQILNGRQELMFYNPEIFFILKKLFSIVDGLDIACPVFDIEMLDSMVREYLIGNKFFDEWKKILLNTPREKGKIPFAFHTWFDAFRTLKFVHFCESRYPRMHLMEAYVGIYEKSGRRLPDHVRSSEKNLLGFMRNKKRRVL